MKKFIRYIIFIVIALIVTKWIVYFLPSNHNSIQIIKRENILDKNNTKVTEVELLLDLKDLKDEIEDEFENARDDINDYISEQIALQKQEAKYRLTKEDGFLDWLFGYWTGWAMMWKKVKGFFGSDDNEVKYVSDEFKNQVILIGLNEKLENINEYARNRMEDFYKSAITSTINYINDQLEELKNQGYSDIKVDRVTIPWATYIVQRSGDILAVEEISGISMSGLGLVIGKYVGSKIASIIGPKLLGIVEAKTASIIAGKIASLSELVFAPIVDYFMNEAVKEIEYDKTKEEFEDVINSVFNDIEYNLRNTIDNRLIEIKNDIYRELNKKVRIIAKEKN